MGLVEIFPHSVGLYSVLLTVFLALQKLFSFIRSYLLSICVIGILLSKFSPMPVHSRLCTMLSYIVFSVAGFMLKSLTYLDLSFVKGH